MKQKKVLEKLIILVTDEDNSPVAGVRVALTDGGGLVKRQTFTDETGLAVFRDISFDRYSLEFSLEGFAVYRVADLDVHAGLKPELKVVMGEQGFSLQEPAITRREKRKLLIRKKKGGARKKRKPGRAWWKRGSADSETAFGDAGADEEIEMIEEDEGEAPAYDMGDTGELILHGPRGIRETYATVTVFYGTDRAGSAAGKTGWSYGSGRGELQTGCCLVSIPRDHTMGELEKPSIWRLELRQDPEKHVVLLSVEPLARDRFHARLSENVAESGKKEGLLFIHGFNVTFEEAALRTAQLSYDLGIETPLMFSWPSRGKLTPLGYTHDENNVSWAEPHIRQFITDLAGNVRFSKLHLVAHSMGNRVLTEVLGQTTVIIRVAGKPLINEVILTAPDIDADTFINKIAPKIKNSAQRITLYASSHDTALNFSQTVHGYPRAGDSGEKIVIIQGMDTVDVSPLKTGFMGHSYYCENRDVMNDLFMLIAHALAPDERNLLKKNTGGGDYWTFRR